MSVDDRGRKRSDWHSTPLDLDEFVAVLGSLAICQQTSYPIAQRILGNVSRHGDRSLEKQVYPTFSS